MNLSIKQKIEDLKEEVIKHTLLYEKGTPIITDSEFDYLYFQLVQLEKANPEYITEDSPTQRIYGVILDGLTKVVHEERLLSLDKANKEEDIRKFLNRFDETEIIRVGLKEDGLTVKLDYNNGVLQQASTRGYKGMEGEDVTHTIRLLDTVPTHINTKNRVSIRGEAIIPYEDFKRVNSDGKYISPRNLVSGSVRTLEAKTARDRGVKVIVFDVLNAEELGHETEDQSIAFLIDEGFEMSEQKKFYNDEKGKDLIVEYCLNFEEEKRSTIDHMIDGLVLKVGYYATRRKAGTTNAHPKWALAYKFHSLDATTVIKDIALTVGKTGVVTPNAVLAPVEIDGVTIGKASLANFANVKKRDIRIGDTVVVARANDVIPQVVSVVKENRTGNEKEIKMPTHCSVCHHKLVYEKGKDSEGNEALFPYCKNPECEAQITRTLEHFVSKSGLDIDGLGAETVKTLYKEGLIEDIPSIYQLYTKKNELLVLDKFKEKRVTKLLDGIEASKKKTLAIVIRSLGIRNLGDNVSSIITDKYKTWEEIKQAVTDNSMEEYLEDVSGIGDTLKETVLTVFTDKKTVHILDTLQAEGFHLTQPLEEKASNLEGSTFVITGKLSQSRSIIKNQIEQAGGKVTGSVTSNTNYLVLGGYNDDTGEFEGSMSSKHKKAVENNIPIISENKLETLLNN